MSTPSPPVPRSRLRRLLGLTDRLAGGTAGLGAGLVRLGLLLLGSHLAADHLDDVVLGVFGAAEQLATRHLEGPALGAAAALGLAPGRLLVWQGLPLGALATWAALVVELATVLVLWSGVVLVPDARDASWARWRAALGLRAVVRPVALTGIVLAGCWSLAMAVEDVLPPSPLARAAGVLLGGAVLLRHGLELLRRCVVALEPEPRPLAGGLEALALAPLTVLAWREGVPVWGALVQVGEVLP